MLDRKVDYRHAFQDDIQQKNNARVLKSRMEREGDRLYMAMQNAENDRFMERRVLDFMKIYDRPSPVNGIDSQRRKFKT